MKSTWGIPAALCGAVLCSSIAMADAVAPTDIVITDGSIAQSLTGAKGDPAAGKEAFVGRKLGNCLACHVNTDTSTEQFHGEVGPALDGVASRYNEAELRAIIVNSKEVFGEGTIMPAFYRTTGFERPRKKFVGKSILSAQQVEDVLAYLLTLKDKE